MIQDLSEVSVNSAKEAIELYLTGEKERKYASTGMNDKSSRSHVILKIFIESRPKSRPLIKFTSCLMLVDLAGSECIENTKVRGMNKQEGASINRSLLSLSRIIKTLAKNQETKKDNKDKDKALKDGYINYRDSKLTRIFEPIFKGTCKTIVICTVSPLNEHLQESINTLRFGMDAGALVLKLVPQREEVNMLSDDQKDQYNSLAEEKESLIHENQELEKKIIDQDHEG